MARFGVDSALAAGPALWDRLTAAAGAPPAFWFRYIGGPYAATAEEVRWLHARGVAVGLVYNGATAVSVAGGYDSGRADAAAAVAAARRLGAPPGTCLFADVETAWSPTPAWVTGWADGQVEGGYGGCMGLYGNPLAPAFAAALAAARARSANAGRLFLWSAQPEPGECPAAAAPAWRPDTAAGAPVAVWQFAEAAYGGVVDLDLADDAFAGLWEPPPPDPAFADVPARAWYARDVEAAVRAGLLTGVARGRFAPLARATRADLAALAARIARRAGWS